jgi:hypothetical protein
MQQMDRNHDGCGIVTGGGMIYEPLPGIEGKVRSCEG